jgi:hypothetical protein
LQDKSEAARVPSENATDNTTEKETSEQEQPSPVKESRKRSSRNTKVKTEPAEQSGVQVKMEM